MLLLLFLGNAKEKKEEREKRDHKRNGTPPGPGPKGNGKLPPTENDCTPPKELTGSRTKKDDEQVDDKDTEGR